MFVITRLMAFLTPQVQPRTLETETEHAISFEEENGQVLDAFLKSCTGTAPTQLVPANAVPTIIFESTILMQSLNVIEKILRNLLTSPTPLILYHHNLTTPMDYHTYVQPNVLQVCKVFHNIGVPILYGENVLTTSSPATSYDFDKHLLSLPGSKRQMITNVKLEIDWADQLWAKFPLVAVALGELKGLQKLEIFIVEKEKTVEKKQTALTEKDANQKMTIKHGQLSPGKDRSAHPRAPAPNRQNGLPKREGPLANVMLKAEMKMLRELVTGFKGLKEFRLVGFKDEVFAWCLEEHVRMGNHECHS